MKMKKVGESHSRWAEYAQNQCWAPSADSSKLLWEGSTLVGLYPTSHSSSWRDYADMERAGYAALTIHGRDS